jgi:RNA polymerase sigma-70 factor (ECF subfamily)
VIRKSQVGCEKVLVAAAQRGRTIAFDELFQPHVERLLRIIHQITKNREDAEDVLQDSFLRAFIHIKDFGGRSSFSTWLTRIAINSALMKLRKNRAGREVAREESADDGESSRRYEPVECRPNPEERCAQRERKRMLTEAISALRPAIRQVVEIRQLQEVSIEETAQILGISVAAAKGRLFHGRVALRSALQSRTISRNRLYRAA